MTLLTLTLLFGITMLLGVINIVIAKCRIKTDKEKVEAFLAHVNHFIGPDARQRNQGKDIQFILANYHEVATIIDEGIYNCPITQLGTQLSLNTTLDSDLWPRILAEVVKFDGKKTNENIKLTKQFFNPFVLIYRGVELVMDVMFGYLIRKFTPGFKPENNALWKIINVVLSVAGSLCSILSFVLNK